MVPKVSVIIPIYNTAAYLQQALDSICNQTLKELQIILINDGSTDNSIDIIKEYAKKDNRIEWYEQYNQGLATTRNFGITRAKGKYIYFMDSDDYLNDTCLNTCFTLCEKENLDYIWFDAQVLEDLKQDIHNLNYNRENLINPSIVWNSHELFRQSLLKHCFQTSVCILFIKKEVIQINKLSFPEGYIHEDNSFTLHLMLCAKNARYVPMAFFYRRIRQGSIMTNRFNYRNILGYWKAACIAKSLAVQHPEWISLIELFLKKTFDSVIWQGHRLTWGEKLKTVKLFYQHSLIRYGSLKSWLAFWLKRS